MPYVSSFELIETYADGSSVTVPGDVSVVDIWAIGAGGSGKQNGAGGGAGGVAYKQYSVRSSEWGTTLTISVGLGAATYDGGDSYVNGTLDGAAITTLEGKGGKKASGPQGLAGGAGGTANGGTANTTGEDGQDYDSENDIVGLGGKIQDETILNITQNGTYGAGGNGDTDADIPGFDGLIIFHWRS